MVFRFVIAWHASEEMCKWTVVVGADHAVRLSSPWWSLDDLANETTRVNEKGDDAR